MCIEITIIVRTFLQNGLGCLPVSYRIVVNLNLKNLKRKKLKQRIKVKKISPKKLEKNLTELSLNENLYIKEETKITERFDKKFNNS